MSASPRFNEHILAADGVQLAVHHASCDAPRALIVVTHGFGEHQGRYAAFVKRLVTQGYAVAIYDLRGHGDSTGKRGFAPSHEALQDDLKRVIVNAQARHEKLLPLVLFGHSMGGNITGNYVLRNPQGVSAVILSAPWFRLAIDPPAWKLALARSIGKMWSGFSLPAGVDAAVLSHDARVVRAYRSDPKVHGKISASLFFACRDAADYALKNAKKLQSPLLIQHGGADALIAPSGSREFYERAPKNLASRKEYLGLYHEIYNESDNEAVWRDMLQWLSACNFQRNQA
jgi:alpha-beta hydrolase superfamily lysophospholipase